jgi:hypothetical protein
MAMLSCAVVLAACAVPDHPDASLEAMDAGGGGPHLYGASYPYAYPVVPTDGEAWGDLCSLDGAIRPNVCDWVGRPVATTAPANNSNVYAWASTQWSPRQLTQDDILAGFSITSFTGGSTVEVGATVTNPTFTAAYSSTPASASITNTDGIDSPLTLSTPFTSGTVVGSFSHSSVATVTFTLTAISTSTKSASSSILFLARTFSGLATAGATSATASGTSAVLVGATGTLTGTTGFGGLFASIVGQSFGPFNPTAQKIDILTPHTSSVHTFKDQNGFGFPMNSPTTFTFTNANAATISMDLYESTNLLSTTFTITVST